MLIGMAFCFVVMFGSMRLIARTRPVDVRPYWPQETPQRYPNRPPGGMPTRRGTAGKRGLTMMIGMGLFWLAVILSFIWLIRDGTGRRLRPPDETALTILDRRFAEGASRSTTTTSAEPPPARRCRALTNTSPPTRPKGISNEKARNPSAAAGGAAFALHHLAPRVRAMHTHCREMMRTHCGTVH